MAPNILTLNLFVTCQVGSSPRFFNPRKQELDKDAFDVSRMFATCFGSIGVPLVVLNDRYSAETGIHMEGVVYYNSVFKQLLRGNQIVDE